MIKSAPNEIPAEKRKAKTSAVNISGAADGLRAKDFTPHAPTKAITIDGPRVLKNKTNIMVKLCIRL